MFLVLLPFAGTTSATPYGVDPGGPGYLPDSTDHWFCFDNVPGDQQSRYFSAMTYVDDATTMWDQFAGGCGTATDVIYRLETPIAEFPGARGYAPCRDRTGFGNIFCQQGHAIIDNGQIFIENGGWGGDPGMFDFNLHKTIRHETGHTIGLGHSGGVHNMVSGPVPYNWLYLAYLGHDICHVNWLWGGPTC